ncbi:hypothetical protein BN1708_014729 [Verticillium longisporum]|uniref:F-box domain-containing protein n=2 Tax=Verticillium longisporum TaxID=100787 RepID=A0A0G4LYX6_VERLO|nr:hypothetical protein BN1708_014729 [Verticillium longisporum]
MASLVLARSPMGVSFEDLPCEVTLEILFRLCDMRSIYNLIVAAPSASRIFDEFGPEILEYVLPNSVTPELLTAPRIPHIVRLVARIRQSTPSNPPAPNFASFLDSYLRRKEKDFGTMEPGPLTGLLCDMRSIYNLIVAAPSASRIFDEFGPEILEYVLPNSVTPELLTAPRIPHIVRLVARIRQSTPSNPPAPNFASFLDSYLRRKEKDFGTMEPGPLTGLSLRATLRESPDGLSARQLLFLARRIASIATGGFQFFHDRCMSINAEHLADASSEYLQPPRGFPWSQRFEGRPYRPESGGPPSWYEMQHMTRGLWNLQVIYELRNAAKEGRLGWTAHDVEQIWAMDVNAWFGHPTVYSEEVLTALYYVHHLEGKPLADSCIGHPFSAPSTGPLGEYPLQLPKPLASTTREVTALGETTNVWPADVPHPPRGDFRARFGFEAYGYKWAQLLSQNVRSPIRTVSFRPFRALGFGLWDRQRLVAFGLVDAPPGELAMMMAPKTTGDFFAWRSWLDEGARAEIEARQEGEWRSGRMGGLLRITGCS